MSANKTPLETVKEHHGGKDKLVDKILGVLDGGGDDKGALKERLLAASNQKLLRLAKISETMKAKYGSRDQLVHTVAGALGRAKDNDYVRRLGEYTPGRLLDMAQSLAKRAGGKLADAKAEAKSAAHNVASRATTATRKPTGKKAEK